MDGKIIFRNRLHLRNNWDILIRHGCSEEKTLQERTQARGEESLREPRREEERMPEVLDRQGVEVEGEKMRTLLTALFALFCAALSFGQSKGNAKGKANAAPKKEAPIEWTQCVEPVEAYGGHVRWTPEETVKVLLQEKESKEAQDYPYRNWEIASMSLDWFSGTKRVPLNEIKGHMPRAMLLRMRFPVDQNPPVDAKGYADLIAAEKAYEDSTKSADAARQYLLDLIKKYGVGPQATLDQDMGGATAMGGCNRYEKVAAQ